jgi:hypothetical protein
MLNQSAAPIVIANPWLRLKISPLSASSAAFLSNCHLSCCRAAFDFIRSKSRLAVLAVACAHQNSDVSESLFDEREIIAKLSPLLVCEGCNSLELGMMLILAESAGLAKGSIDATGGKRKRSSR